MIANDPTRMLPCPTAVYLRGLEGALRDAAPGDVGMILRAVRLVLTNVDYSLARLGPEDALERDALVELFEVATQVRRHVIALYDREVRPS